MFAEPRKLKGLMLGTLVLMGVLLYANTLRVPFYLDDVANIEENRAIQLHSLQFSNLAGAGTGGLLTNRPVANLSFALNYYINGMNPAGFHVVNTLIHVLAGVFLFLFLVKTFGLPQHAVARDDALVLAFGGALLWLVNPLHTQSVTYIVQRMNSLAALFFVMALYCYAQGRTEAGKGRQLTWLAGAGVSGLLALGTKENAATLPFFILLYEWFFIQDLSSAWLRKHLPLFLGVLIAIALIGYFYLGTTPFDAIQATYKMRDFSLIERVLTQFRVVIFYIGLLLFPYPARLSLEHDFPVSHSLFNPPMTFFAILAILALLGLALYLARRQRFIAFAILWFLGNLVIESSVIGLEMVFEHRTYLPAMLVFPMIVLLLGRWLKAPPLWVVLGVLTIVFSWWTVERNNLWLDPVKFWQECVHKAPTNPRPYNNLGQVLFERGEVEAAVGQYRQALQHKPSFFMAHNNLGIALKTQGKIREAARHFVMALDGDPGNAKIHNNLGNIYAGLGDYDKAALHLEEALRIDPGYASAYNNLGNLMMFKGRVSEAITYYRQALAITPGNADARHNLGVALRQAAKLPVSR